MQQSSYKHFRGGSKYPCISIYIPLTIPVIICHYYIIILDTPRKKKINIWNPKNWEVPAVSFQGEYSFIENYPLFDTLIHPKKFQADYAGQAASEAAKVAGLVAATQAADVRNLPTVDGFRNPMNPTTVWMYPKPLGNDGIKLPVPQLVRWISEPSTVVVQGL